MKKYYLIPMTDDSIYLKDKSLREILNCSYPELGQREEERISILYSVRPIDPMPESVEKKYEEHKKETRKMYNQMQVPYYLIAYGNDKCAKEILTESKITSKYKAALGIRTVSKEVAEEYYQSSNYEEKISNFFNNINKPYKNPFPSNDTYEFEGYIDGKINNQDIKGNFNGKIKIKKLELKPKK